MLNKYCFRKKLRSIHLLVGLSTNGKSTTPKKKKKPKSDFHSPIAIASKPHSLSKFLASPALKLREGINPQTVRFLTFYFTVYSIHIYMSSFVAGTISELWVLIALSVSQWLSSSMGAFYNDDSSRSLYSFGSCHDLRFSSKHVHDNVHGSIYLDPVLSLPLFLFITIVFSHS